MSIGDIINISKKTFDSTINVKRGPFFTQSEDSSRNREEISEYVEPTFVVMTKELRLQLCPLLSVHQ